MFLKIKIQTIKIQTKINSNNEKISVLQKEVAKVQKEINHLNTHTGDTGKAKKELYF